MDAGSRTAANGRDAELTALLAEYEVAAREGARCVLVTGEPGIGKSWLLRQASAAAAERGARVLEGYAIELPGAPPAYPLDRALAPALRDSLPRELATARAVLADAGIGTAPRNAPVPAQMPADAGRVRAFQALADVCAWLADAQPLVVVLDDMQWAQPFTWDALQYAVRALSGSPVLFLLAAREELMLRRGEESVPALGELLRLRLMQHISLRPLAEQSIAALAAERLGSEPTPRLAAFIAERSEGNPFFAEEVLNDCRERGLLVQADGAWELREGLRAGADLPPTVRLAIGARLERMPPECEHTLAMAAFFGRSFATHDVANALGTDTAATAGTLHVAEVAALVEATRTGWRFRHDVIREALLERHRDEAPRLHAAVAGALTRGAGYAPSVETLAALAHHWHEAGEPAKAAPAALNAARAGLAAHAPLEALALARSGRLSVEQAHAGDAAAPALFDARLTHGEIALAATEYAEAADALRAALEAATAAGEPAREGQAWLRLGTVHRRQELANEAVEAYGRAVALLDESTDGPLLAEALTALCDVEGLTRANYEEARSAGEHALAVARRLGDRGIEARATLALANAETRAVDPLAARQLQLRALEHALAADDPALGAEVCAALANSFYWTGEIRESRRYAEQRLELAERAMDVFALRHAHSWLALLAVTRGDWDDARTLITRAEDALAGLDSPEPLAFVHVVEAFLSLRLGDVDAAAERLRDAIAVFERVDPGTVIWYASLFALALAEAGATEEARKVAVAQEARLDALPEPALPARSARCALGLAYVALGDSEAAARCEEALRPYAADFHWSPARFTLGRLAALRGDTTTALDDLEAAEALARAQELWPDLALTLLAKAGLLPRREAVPLLDEAEALFGALGMSGGLEEVERLRRAAANSAPGGLSRRELEVLALVAQGRTNREIAAALVISERTAINHVSHIFDKLGVENRSGATAFALRHGLA